MQQDGGVVLLSDYTIYMRQRDGGWQCGWHTASKAHLRVLRHGTHRCRLQVLQADGGTRCACINAAALALAHAGIPMRDLVAGVAAGYLQGTPLLDLNYMEDAGGGPDVSVALHPSLDRLVLLQMDGRLPDSTFEEVVALAQDGCRAVAAVMRTELLKHTKRHALALALGS